MDEFSKAANEIYETAMKEIEQFFDEVSVAFEEVAEEVGDAVFSGMELFWQEVFEPVIELLEVEIIGEWDIDLDTDSDRDFALVTYVHPNGRTHPACIGCRHYHGYVYNGNLFVCGYHPYGWDDDRCPDWEGSDYVSNRDSDKV